MSSEHVVPIKIYFSVFFALIALTTLTVVAANIDLGPFNAVVALTIAVVKGSLVLLFFMHLRYTPRLTWLVVSAAFVWLGILIVLTVGDNLTRGWLQLLSH
jgi:cytochrome c oxidase subunit IV